MLEELKVEMGDWRESGGEKGEETVPDPGEEEDSHADEDTLIVNDKLDNVEDQEISDKMKEIVMKTVEEEKDEQKYNLRGRYK